LQPPGGRPELPNRTGQDGRWEFSPPPHRKRRLTNSKHDSVTAAIHGSNTPGGIPTASLPMIFPTTVAGDIGISGRSAEMSFPTVRLSYAFVCIRRHSSRSLGSAGGSFLSPKTLLFGVITRTSSTYLLTALPQSVCIVETFLLFLADMTDKTDGITQNHSPQYSPPKAIVLQYVPISIHRFSHPDPLRM
jgi:hypothetical protein